MKHFAIDLFAGIGGLRLGLHKAFNQPIKSSRFENAQQDKVLFVYSNEIDKYASETYLKNYLECPQGDITEINPTRLPPFQVILSGFPCQAFSIAGKRKGFADRRGNLFFYVAEIIRQYQPQAILLENVKNLTTHDKGRTFSVIKSTLEKDLGYTIYAKVLNSRNFRVPQNRERIFIVGFKEPVNFVFPQPTGEIMLKDILEPHVDPKYYVSHRYLESMKAHRARHEAKGHGFGYEVLNRDGVANAIVVGGMGHERNLIQDQLLDNAWKPGLDESLPNEEGLRKMTPREWARLQGYPDDFKFPVSDTQAYKQLGNSVSVPVLVEICKEIKKSLESI